MKSTPLLSHTKPKVFIRYETPRGTTSLQDLFKLRKRASFISSFQFFNPKSQHLNSFTNFTSLKKTFRTISTVTLAEKFFQKSSPLLFQIKPQNSIRLLFDGPRETNQSRSRAIFPLNPKNLRIFLSRQRPSQIKRLELTYKPHDDLNKGLQKIFRPISLLVNLENLKVRLQKKNPEQLKLASQTARFFCKKLSYLKSLKKILIKSLWLPESDHPKLLSILKKLQNLEQYSFMYDPQEIQYRSPETIRKFEQDFVLALEALENNKKITEVAISIKSLYKGHEKAVYEAVNRYLQSKNSEIITLHLDLCFFDFPKETFKICGQLSQVQDLSIKLSSKYQIPSSELVDGLNCIADIQSKEIGALTIDFSEMNLLGLDETLNLSLVKILTSLKNLSELGLKFTKDISSIWNRAFKELIGIQLAIKTLRVDFEFDDERDLTDGAYFNFLGSLGSQKSLENFCLNIRLRGRDKNKEKVTTKEINLVLQKLNCLSFLKRLKVTFEKGFSHVKLRDMLRLKSLQDLAWIPKLWIAWENNIITEYNFVHNS